MCKQARLKDPNIARKYIHEIPMKKKHPLYCEVRPNGLGNDPWDALKLNSLLSFNIRVKLTALLR